MVPIPNLDFELTVELERKEFAKQVKRLPKHAHVAIQVSDGKLGIGAKADDSDVFDGEYHSLATTDFDGNYEAKALYNKDYLTSMIDGLEAIGADTMELSWDESFPLRVRAQSKHIETEWFIAPRVQSE